MKSRITIVWLAILLVVLGSGFYIKKRAHTLPDAHTTRITEITQSNRIMAHGMVVPIEAQYLLTPMDSTVVRFWHAFGDQVHVGDRLVELQDEQIYKDFSEALVSYLKHKDRLALASKKLTGEKELLEEGVIAEHEYMQHQSDQQNTYVDWLQSRIKLERLAKWVNVSMADLDRLTLSNQAGIEKQLRQPLAIYLRAEREGRLYAPLPKMGKNKDDKAAHLAEGVRLKQGQSLGLVALGDQVQVHFQVSEQDIQNIEPGQTVQVRLESQPSALWQVSVESANVHQPSERASGEPSTFLVIAKSENAPPQWVHIGVKVQGSILGERKTYRVVPFSAVFEKNQRYWVSVKRQGQWQDVSVQTHVMTPDTVGLIGDVRVGEEVRLYD